jgi:hypothetical protein
MRYIISPELCPPLRNALLGFLAIQLLALMPVRMATAQAAPDRHSSGMIAVIKYWRTVMGPAGTVEVCPQPPQEPAQLERELRRGLLETELVNVRVAARCHEGNSPIDSGDRPVMQLLGVIQMGDSTVLHGFTWIDRHTYVGTIFSLTDGPRVAVKSMWNSAITHLDRIEKRLQEPMRF